MKVLKAPTNTSSQASITARALRALGVRVKGLVLGSSKYVEDRDLEVVWVRRQGPRRIFLTSLWAMKLFKNLIGADVLHWYSGKLIMPFKLDLKLSKISKRRFVEWMGSDIRDPELEAQDNPYFRRLLDEGYVKPTKKPLELQRLYAEEGFSFIVSESTEDYVMVDAPLYRVPKRIDLSQLEPSFPKPSPDVRPLIVHAATDFKIKGTEAVIRAVRKLDDRVRFKLLHGISRAEALKWIERCDIFLDQFVLGHYGVAAIEAMALGKPVLGYIKESAIKKYPGLPIVNTVQEEIADRIKELLKEPDLLEELGKRGRRYVEERHDSIKLAKLLVNVYRYSSL